MLSWCARTIRKLWRLGRYLCVGAQEPSQDPACEPQSQRRAPWGIFLRRVGRLSLSVGTAGVAAGLGWWISGNLGLGVIAIIIAHELGHFFMALAQGAQASLPVFIPLGILVIGLTPVKGIRDEAMLPIAVAGPVVGALAAGVVATVGLVLGIKMLFWLAVLALGFEIMAGTIGSDGRIIREELRARRAR